MNQSDNFFLTFFPKLLKLSLFFFFCLIFFLLSCRVTPACPGLDGVSSFPRFGIVIFPCTLPPLKVLLFLGYIGLSPSGMEAV